MSEESSSADETNSSSISRGHSLINIRDLNSGEENNGIISSIFRPDDSNEAFISPCRCIGTLKFIHKSCFEMSITFKGKGICDLCKTMIPYFVEANEKQLQRKLKKVPKNI
ncbi:hypothetical protein Avbf_09905 [Armadillidium vulgare]|nr:hypothetical protein Avbf_09905 [Armadillidium vulgare]